MNVSLEKRLIECLDALEQGESLDVILARYPEDADDLSPYLETAVSLQNLKIQPTVAAKQSSKAQFLETAAAIRRRKTAPPFKLRLRQILRPLAGLAVLLFLLSAVLIPVSARAVPGDALYSTKRLIEDTRLNLTNNATGKLQLVEQYNQERIAEINTLMAEGRQSSVSFRGPIQAIDKQAWIIAGLTTQLAEHIIIEGVPEIGLTAIVTGQTKGGELFAFIIVIPDGGNPTPVLPVPTLPTPVLTLPATETISSPTASPTASPTSEPTSTPTPSATATETPTATATPTETPTETAVPPSTMPPTSTAPPPDNDNDDSNNNDDDDSNDSDSDSDDDDSDNDDDDSEDEDEDNDNNEENEDDDDDDDDDDNHNESENDNK